MKKSSSDKINEIINSGLLHYDLKKQSCKIQKENENTRIKMNEI